MPKKIPLKVKSENIKKVICIMHEESLPSDRQYCFLADVRFSKQVLKKSSETNSKVKRTHIVVCCVFSLEKNRLAVF